MTTVNSKYKLEIEKKLDEFKFAKDWSDFIGLIDSLISIVKKHRQNFIPSIHQLVKRLNQLLNPVLPGGVHLKTFECYNAIIDSVSKENLIKDFDVFTLGLFSFSTRCRIGVAGNYIDLIERLIKYLGNEMHSYTDHVILGLLPFLESENSEFFYRSYAILVRFITEVTEKRFYIGIWTNFVNYPELRHSILNFLSRYKTIVIPDYGLVNTALCSGLNSDNIFVIRFILEISTRDYPFTSEFISQFGNQLDQTDKNDKSQSTLKENGESVESNIRSPTIIYLDQIINDEKLQNSVVEQHSDNNKDEKNIRNNVNSVLLMESVMGSINKLTASERPGTPSDSIFDLPSENNIPPLKSQLVITDIALKDFEHLNDREKESFIEKLKYLNNLLLKSVLMIFLKKEVSLNKRAYKWLGFDDVITLKDMDYLERGLRQYVNTSVDDLCSLFKIMNSLMYKETVVRFLMERIVVDSLKIIKKNEKDRTNDSFVSLEKNVRIFISLSLDELFRVFYLNLDKIFKDLVYIESIESTTKDYDFISSESTMDNLASLNTNIHKNLAEEFIDLILYSINTLGALDATVSSVHLPILCCLLIGNRNKLSNTGVEMLMSLLNLVAKDQTMRTEIINQERVTIFYQYKNEEKQIDIGDFNLIKSMATELCNMNIYDESRTDIMYWTSSDLSDHNGILEWNENKNVTYLNRRRPIFNFKEIDIKLIFNFIEKFGFKDFSTEFLSILGSCLSFNYKFLDLIRILDFYINKSHLMINLWNDFVSSKNSKFLYFFDEILIDNFLIEILPTVSLEDICLFLKTPLEMGRHLDIFYRVASISDTENSTFIDLVVNIKNSKFLVEHLFDLFYQNTSSKSNTTRINNSVDYVEEKSIDLSIIPILKVFRLLISNENFIEFLTLERRIELKAFGEIGVLQALVDFTKTLILNNYLTRETDEKTLMININSEESKTNIKGNSANHINSNSVNHTNGNSVNHTNNMVDYNNNVVHYTNDNDSNHSNNIVEYINNNIGSHADYSNINNNADYSNINNNVEYPNINNNVKYPNIDNNDLNHINNIKEKSLNNDKRGNAIRHLRRPIIEEDLESIIERDALNSFENISALKSIDNNSIEPTENSIKSKEYQFINYDNIFNEIKENLRLSSINPILKSSTEILRMSFTILNLINEKGIKVQNLLNPKDFFPVIKAHKKDYILLIKSLFLFSDHIDFIFDNFMHFYKSVLQEISKLSIKNEFLSHIAKFNTKCSVEIIFESIQYFGDFRDFNITDFYNKAIHILIQECKKYCVVYKYFNKTYNRISHQSICDFGNNVINSFTEEKYENIDYSLYKAKMTKGEMKSVCDSELPLVLVYTGDLTMILKMYDELYNRNQNLLFNCMPDSLDFLYLFGVIHNKADVFRRMLFKLKNNRLMFRFFKIYCKMLTTEEKRQILKQDGDLLRNIFLFGLQDNASILFVLEIFKDQQFSDFSRLIFSTILTSLESKIDFIIKNNGSLSQEIKILKNFTKLDIKDNATILLLKFRIFEILGYKKHCDEALEMIQYYLKLRPNDKAFIDGFIGYFNKNFFDFGLKVKSAIFNLISSSSNFDSFIVLDTLITGMDTTFFMSAQSGEQLKIQNIKRISFLILSQPFNKFSTKSDHFVSLINNNLHLSNSVKAEILRLCSCLLIKIDHFYLQTLYPILIEDFIGGSNFHELRLLSEMIRFVDLSIWMRSPVFCFKILFAENHEFNRALKTKLNLNSDNSNISLLEYTVVDTLPNLLAFITDKPLNWNDIDLYFKNVEGYYYHILESSVKIDLEKTEASLLRSFMEI